MTQPLGMSGEEKWWEKEPYAEECYGHAGSTGYETHYDIPAILKEQRRLVLAEVREMIEKKYEKEAHLNKHCGDKPKHELCKDCTWGVNVMAEYHDILSRLESLDKMV